MTTQAMIALVDVTKVYPGSTTPTVQDLSFEVPEGETCVVIGPSGSGKTTLKMVNRLIEPSGGKIHINGENIMQPVILRRSIMAGIRTSAVLVVASATLAAFIGGGPGDLILAGRSLGEEHIMLPGAIPATLLAFYLEERFGRLQQVVTPRGLREEEPGVQVQGDEPLPFLASVMLMPLVFGSMLPWERIIAEGGEVQVLTAFHPAYRMIGVPVLIPGLLAALWPRNERSWLVTPLTTGASVLALLWTVIGLLLLSQGLPTGLGLYLQSGAVVALAIITVLEYRGHQRGALDEPAEVGPAGLPVSPG